jgi:hypothetical protein
MRRIDVHDLITAQPLTAAAAVELRDILGSNLSGKPRAEVALGNLLNSVIRQNVSQHATAVQQAEEEMIERAVAIADGFDAVDAVVRTAARDLDAGRIDARTARARLASADKDRQSLAARVEQLRRDDEATTELAQQDPVEWQAEMLRKYPAMRRGLPVLSRAALAEHA